jgi:hypothetical protein
MDGIDFISNFIRATGLPSELVRAELQKISAESGKSIDSLSLSDLRMLLVDYLQDALLTAHNEYTEKNGS